MDPKRRPPTAWLRRCMSSIARAGKLAPEAAQRVCAGNWWHRAGATAKAGIVKKYARGVTRAARGQMLRAEAASERRGKGGAGHCSICRGPHKWKHGRA